MRQIAKEEGLMYFKERWAIQQLIDGEMIVYPMCAMTAKDTALVLQGIYRGFHLGLTVCVDGSRKFVLHGADLIVALRAVRDGTLTVFFDAERDCFTTQEQEICVSVTDMIHFTWGRGGFRWEYDSGYAPSLLGKQESKVFIQHYQEARSRLEVGTLDVYVSRKQDEEMVAHARALSVHLTCNSEFPGQDNGQG